MFCPECGKLCKNARGLGVHRRSKHPDSVMAEYEEVKSQTHQISWSDEDLRVLAQTEIELRAAGSVRLINVAIAEKLQWPNLDFNKVKCQRQTQKYKTLLEEEQSIKVLEDRLAQVDFLPSTPLSPLPSESVAGRESTPPRVETQMPDEDPAAEGWSYMFRGALDRYAESLGDWFAEVWDVETQTLAPWPEIEARWEQWLFNTVKTAKIVADPPKQGGRPPRQAKPKKGKKMTRANRRAKARADTLHSYEKRPERTIKEILRGDFGTPAKAVPGQYEFWKEIFNQPSVADPRVIEPSEVFWSIAGFIRPSMVEAAISDMADGAPGLDGFRKRDLSKFGVQNLGAWFSIFLYAGRTPRGLKKGRTTLIEKVKGTDDPSQFRPITMSSVLLRLFHSLLASRLATVPIPLSQKGFRAFDGCGENVVLLEALLKQSQAALKELHVGFMDVRKAFDSVSHESIIVAARAAGVPPPLLKYLENFHKDLTTVLTCDPLQREIEVNAGSRQGDPMSGYLFNFAMVLAIAELPPTLGAEIGQYEGEMKRVNNGQLADDTFLASRNRTGLQKLFAQFAAELLRMGMKLNASKSATLSIVPDKRRKRWFTSSQPILHHDGQEVKTLGIADTYKYLGVQFGAKGVERDVKPESFGLQLDRLKKSALLPQHKLYGLRTVLIPSFYYQLTLTSRSDKLLKRMDLVSRTFVREVLHLPLDTPVAFYHASHRDGGLGIPCFLSQVVRLRRERLERIARSGDPVLKVLTETDWFKKKESEATRECRVGCKFNFKLTESKDLNTSLWAEALHRTCDGKGLAHHTKQKSRSYWIIDRDSRLKGWEYVKAVHVRGNLLTTPARRLRGRQGCRNCPRCPGYVHNLAHILQQCPVSHGFRSLRHNYLCGFLKGYLESSGWKVLEEPRIPTPAREKKFVKPDLICTKDQTCVVLDPQICADNACMKTRNKMKVDRYSIPEVMSYCRDLFSEWTPKHHVLVTGLIVDWRGCWEKASWDFLRKGLSIPAVLLEYASVNILKSAWDAVREDDRRTSKRVRPHTRISPRW